MAFSNDLGPAHDTGLQWIIEGLQKLHDHFFPVFFCNSQPTIIQ